MKIYYVHVLDGMASGEPHGWLGSQPVVAVTRPGDGGVPVRATSRRDAVRRFIDAKGERS